MADDNTQNIINFLGKAFDKAIEDAWRGDASNTIVDPSANHEACHVARFVYGVPEPMVDAIKQIPGVQGVSVEGMFCHTKPYAFWDRKAAANGVERRELADLMVEVEIVSRSGSASRAVLVQTKMKKASNWVAPMTISASALAEEQRELYSCLPPFCLELDKRPTADEVRKEKRTVATYPGLALYNLGGKSGLPSKKPAGLVYAVIKGNTPRVSGQRLPWLVEDGRPPLPATTAPFAVPPGVFSLGFGQALASMVVEGRVGRVPAIGVRSDGCQGVPSSWKLLIDDLKAFARRRIADSTWQSSKDPNKKKLLDIRIVPSVGKAASKTLLNRATFTVSNGQVVALTKCVRAPRWLPESAWRDSFDTIAGGEWLDSGGGNNEDLRNFEALIPEGGFGFLKIRIEVSDDLR